MPPGLTTWTVPWSDWVVRKRIADAVVAAVAVGGEAVDRVLRVEARHGDEGDAVEDQRVALQPLRPGEGGECGEDEEGEDEAWPSASAVVAALSSPTITETGAPPETDSMSALISFTCEMPSALATLRASGAWPRSNMTMLSAKLVLLLVTAPSLKPLPSTLSP